MKNTRFEPLALVLPALSGRHSTQSRQDKLLKYRHRVLLTVSRIVFLVLYECVVLEGWV